MAMSREKAKELLPIIQAYAEGKVIQFRQPDGVWVDVDTQDEAEFSHAAKDYRLKPAPAYRPFTMQEFVNGYAYYWSKRLVRPKNHESLFYAITKVEQDGVTLNAVLHISWQTLTCDFIWQDGTPIGVYE